MGTVHDRRNRQQGAQGGERVAKGWQPPGLRTRAEFPGNRVFPGLWDGSVSFGSLVRPTRDTATGDDRKSIEGSFETTRGIEARRRDADPRDVTVYKAPLDVGERSVEVDISGRFHVVSLEIFCCWGGKGSGWW